MMFVHHCYDQEVYRIIRKYRFPCIIGLLHVPHNLLVYKIHYRRARAWPSAREQRFLANNYTSLINSLFNVYDILYHVTRKRLNVFLMRLIINLRYKLVDYVYPTNKSRY